LAHPIKEILDSNTLSRSPPKLAGGNDNIHCCTVQDTSLKKGQRYRQRPRLDLKSEERLKNIHCTVFFNLVFLFLKKNLFFSFFCFSFSTY
jgi:hypothetical protein